MNHCFIYQTPPADFKPCMEVASCYIECQDQLLVLKRASHKSYGHTWGIPAGKIKANETPDEAIIRELQEELDLNISKEQLKELGRVYIRQDSLDFVYYLFGLSLAEFPPLVVNQEEHSEANWMKKEDIKKLTLMPGELETLNYYWSKQKF